MKGKLYIMAWLLAALFAVGCEDLEDTYSDYAGDGMIRYVGKCSDVDIRPGWNRLQVSWKGNLDAAITKVKVTWQSEKDKEPFVRYVEPKNILEGGNLADTIYLDNLQNAVYTVTVSNMTADDKESIVEYAYARPYTPEHEDLRSFGRGIVNFYVINDKLIVTVESQKNTNVKKMMLHYTATDGKEYTWNIQSNVGKKTLAGLAKNMYKLPTKENLGIDFTKPLRVEREGLLEGCMDTIKFEDVVLDMKEQIWSASFTQWLNKTYGPDWAAEVEKIETVELDYDMTNLQDLFYFPNLKKVVLGKNRYVKGEPTQNLSVTDRYALVTLQHLKDLRGVVTERYNQHYFWGEKYGMTHIEMLEDERLIKPGLLVEKGNSNWDEMPVITPLDTKDWEVTCSDTMYNGQKEGGAAYLLDDDNETFFEPGQTLSATVIEVNIDMKKPQVIHGFKVQQPSVASRTDLKYLLSSLKIEVSEDGKKWKDATYENGGVTIGNTLGEVTFITIPEALQHNVQYIRLTVANRQTSTISGGVPLFSLRLGDFIPY